MKVAANILSCSTMVVLMILRFQHNIDEESFNVLVSYLSPVVNDTSEQGWQETTDAALTSLLRSALSKKGMQSNIVQLEKSTDFPIDSSRLQKHIKLVCDRLGKCARLSELKKGK